MYVCMYAYIHIFIYTQRASAACSCSCIANPRAHSYVHTQCAAATQGKAFGFHMYMNRGEIKDIAGKIGCAFACICKQALALGNGLPECTAGTRRVVHIHRRLGPWTEDRMPNWFSGLCEHRALRILQAWVVFFRCSRDVAIKNVLRSFVAAGLSALRKWRNNNKFI